MSAEAVRGLVSGLPSASGANRGGGGVLPSGNNANARGRGDRFGVSRSYPEEDDSGSSDDEGLDELLHFDPLGARWAVEALCLCALLMVPTLHRGGVGCQVEG